MTILVADKFEKIGLEGLKSLGCSVISDPELKEDSLKAKLAETGAEVLVVRSTKVTDAIMEGSKLQLIIRAGAGVDTIDCAGAAKRGIAVTNCPGKNSLAVAELAMGLILAVDRHIPDCVGELRQGKWNKKRYSAAKGVYGRTLGLVGLGRIAQEVAVRAKAFGMDVVAYSRWLTPQVAAAFGVSRAKTLDELVVKSDVISLHVSLNPATKGMISEKLIAAMKPGAYLINTSRAGVIDQDALAKALKEGRIWAGLDVFEGEPATGEAEYDGAMKSLPNVYCTHHIGASTDQAQEAIALETVRIAREFIATGEALNKVAGGGSVETKYLFEVRYAEFQTALPTILKALTDDGVKTADMEYTALPAHNAIAQIAIDKEPSLGALKGIRLLAGVYEADVSPLDNLP